MSEVHGEAEGRHGEGHAIPDQEQAQGVRRSGEEVRLQGSLQGEILCGRAEARDQSLTTSL